ncbi:MAG: hypothetical protein FIA93_01305 [Deltaproteobacteria bacterium]|nr:hypothetical protein [Deltaproteobacteria bacterium]
MGKIAASVKWVLVMLGFLLVLWLPLVVCMDYPEAKEEKGHADALWVDRTERLRLARYHGTQALKITDEVVYIWRDSKWVSVLKRKLPDRLVPGTGSSA